MKTFVCTQFTGHYPVGVAAVVIAPDRVTATLILNEQLKQRFLPGDAAIVNMIEIPTDLPSCVILADGNY